VDVRSATRFRLRRVRSRLDHFKPINDLYGHRLGDEVLRVIATRLSAIVGIDGLVARLGGDEFGILMPVSWDKDAQVRLARRIATEIPQPITLASLVLEVGVSIGVTIDDRDGRRNWELALRDGSEVETLLRQADMAMYRAKTEGRGSYRFFDSAMDDRLQQRVQLEREIKSAIANGEIVPYYQPIVELEGQQTIGYEVLARWHHPREGLLSPGLFIPIAEDTGAISELSIALLANAVADAVDWPPHLSISVNLSPRQFANPRLAREILDVLIQASFPPHRLEIEITESAVVKRLDEAKATLQSLRNLGVRIALDDFGTGYSGLHHLRALHVDTIKIDRSFVTEMLEEPEDAKLVEAMIALGRALGLKTIAEGIETPEVLARLKELGCDAGQGFLFGKPERVPVAADRKTTQLARKIA
jgi:diguanylate cyclase (GGDEF)-like protein